MISENLVRQAEAYVDSGAFFADLSTMVGYPTESARPEGYIAAKAYLDEVLVPVLTELGCSVAEYANPDPSGGPFLVGTRVECPELPTVLCYGHADVVDGQAGRWSEGRDPWTLTADGDRWYGRGAADNKGQHLVNLAALRLLLAEHGPSLGFNLTFLFETGEEVGSPGLAAFAAAHREELRADILIASDGPRLDATTPTLFLGARGGVKLLLDVDLRPDAYHSGNWGGVLRNPATTLAGAVASLVDGHGRIQVPALLPPELPGPVREALAGVTVAGSPGDPAPDEGWGDTGLSAAERLYGPCGCRTRTRAACSTHLHDRPRGQRRPAVRLAHHIAVVPDPDAVHDVLGPRDRAGVQLQHHCRPPRRLHPHHRRGTRHGDRLADLAELPVQIAVHCPLGRW